MKKRCDLRKGQVAIEHLLIVGIAIFVLIPAVMLFYNYARGSNEDVVKNQIGRIGDQITNNADIAYMLGKDTRITLKVNIPEAVENIYVQQGELVADFSTMGGNNSLIFFPDARIKGIDEGPAQQNISNPFHTGFMKIQLESKGDYVLIREIY